MPVRSRSDIRRKGAGRAPTPVNLHSGQEGGARGKARRQTGARRARKGLACVDQASALGAVQRMGLVLWGREGR